jgi:hypothetical protein
MGSTHKNFFKKNQSIQEKKGEIQYTIDLPGPTLKHMSLVTSLLSSPAASRYRRVDAAAPAPLLTNGSRCARDHEFRTLRPRRRASQLNRRTTRLEAPHAPLRSTPRCRYAGRCSPTPCVAGRGRIVWLG